MNKTEITKGSPQLLGVSTDRITTGMAGSVPDTITDIAGFTPKPHTPTLRTHAGCLFSNFCLFESYYTRVHFKSFSPNSKFAWVSIACYFYLNATKRLPGLKFFEFQTFHIFREHSFLELGDFGKKVFFSVHQESDIFGKKLLTIGYQYVPFFLS